MEEEAKKPFKLSPSPLMAGLMLTFALGVDALQFFVGLALTVVVGAGLVVGWMLGLLAYVVLWIWFKLTDNNTQNHFVLMRVLAYYGALVFEMIPGLDFFPGITFGVLCRILISWAGDMKANKLAEQEAEGEELSGRKQRKLDRRMAYMQAREGVESVKRSRAQLQEKARSDAKPGKDRREVERQQQEKAENIGMKAAGIIAPEVALPAKAIAASSTALDAYRKSKKKDGAGATRPKSPNAPSDSPYNDDMREAA